MLIHFLALATPEAWFRLLARRVLRVTPLRLAMLVISMVGAGFIAVFTLPERLLAAPFLLRFRGDEPTFEHEPGVVAVLGYYRSGTTHLQNLLSCDRRFVTPRWVQALAPQGFWASWLVLSGLLTALMGSTRPHDAVGFGPTWPAEDDFGLCNWGLASSLPGRLVIPTQFEHYQRWQFMDELTPAERGRWRRLMASFCWKVTRGRPGRVLLLKSPSHTSRVRELRRLFGDRIKFIVIERDRDEVINSHMAMSKHLGYLLLERLPADEELRATLEEDHDRTLAAMEADLADVPPERVARIGFRALRQDTIGRIRDAYEHLDLGWNDDVASRLEAYLEREGTYTPRHAKDVETTFRRSHASGQRTSVARRLVGLLVGAAAGCALLGAWMGLSHVTGKRWDLAAWPMGMGVGLVAARVAGRGDRWLAVSAGVVFLLLAAAATYLLPEVTYGWTDEHRWKAIGQTFQGPRALVWLVIGLFSAYQCASRRHVRAPG